MVWTSLIHTAHSYLFRALYMLKITFAVYNIYTRRDEWKQGKETLEEGGSNSLTKMTEQLRKYPIQNECLTLDAQRSMNFRSYIHKMKQEVGQQQQQQQKYEWKIPDTNFKWQSCCSVALLKANLIWHGASYEMIELDSTPRFDSVSAHSNEYLGFVYFAILAIIIVVIAIV